MQITKLAIFDDLYSLHLEVVNKVRFTRREIDIIACLLSGRSAKTISTFLSIAQKTIESHVRNIMIKVECNSRDGIIDFIEKSNKLALIRKHYLSMLVRAAFEKILSKISLELGNKAPSCLIISWQEGGHLSSFSQCLENNLKFVGIKTFLEMREEKNFKVNLPTDKGKGSTDWILYLVPSELVLQGSKEDNESLYNFINKVQHNPNSIVVFPSDINFEYNMLEKIYCKNLIKFSEENNYYLAFFKLLSKLLPETDLNKFIRKFVEQYETITAESDEKSSHLVLNNDLLKVSSLVFNKIIKSKKKYIFFTGYFLLAFAVGLFVYFKFNHQVAPIENKEGRGKLSIRPDFIVPTDFLLLDRTALVNEIKTSLEGKKDIQTIALIGIGGAGKTTVARNFARQQDVNVIWELNAETKENFNDSFESLAEALAKTEDEKKKLREFEDLKDVVERERKIILFVKERLKAISNWLLIYDNVNKFKEIQEYFPLDPNTWGNGKVIVTTRDKNIESNSHINKAIFIGELSSKEKLDLFVKIMSNGNPSQFTAYQKVQAKQFLYDIPPFPLDVSIAAYYLKVTNVPYKKYLEHLKENNKDFAAIQESVLKEATEYTKTRYKIITLSLENLINKNKDFSHLLLFISLIDFNNIPRELLSSYKNDIVLEDFIFNLKKYSLITNENPGAHHLPSSFSIHRSTQGISLDYLKNILNLDKNNPQLQIIFQIVLKYISEVTDVEDIIKIKNFISHCEAILQRNDVLDESTRGAFESKLGYVYYYLNDYSKAKQLLEASLINLKKEETKNYKKIAHALRCLGDVYSELGEHEKAKNLCEQSLAIYKEHLSENHKGLPRALAYLGNVYRRLGDYEKAKDLYEKVISIYRQYSPEDHTREARVLAHLGIVYKELGNYAKAKSLFEESLSMYKQSYSENHTRIAWVYAHLGSVYKRLGEHRKAKLFLEYSLKIYKQHFSGDHIRIAWVTSLLGETYNELNDHETAKGLIERSLIIYEKNYGKNHTETARVQKNLGYVYILDGQMEKGERLVRNALSILETNKHPDSYACLEILAELYLRKAYHASHQRKIQESEKYRNQALQLLKRSQEILKNYFPEDSPHAMRIARTFKKAKENDMLGIYTK